MFYSALFTRATLYAGVGASSVSVYLCLSVTSRCSIEMDGRIELVFGLQAFGPPYTVF